MFNYTSDFSNLSHHIIDSYIHNKNIAIDATLGNGYDSDFLSAKFNKVISFDIQEKPCEYYKSKKNSNVEVINDSHDRFDKYVNSNVDCIVYNLGFLPGGDKNITTTYSSTLKSIEIGLEILNNEGLMLITSYRGHEEGNKEYSMLNEYLLSLPKNKYAVMKHEIINRTNKSPLLFVVEKK